jgi:hypothetical protein
MSSRNISILAILSRPVGFPQTYVTLTLTILSRPVGFLAYKDLNHLTITVPDEGFFRNTTVSMVKVTYV